MSNVNDDSRSGKAVRTRRVIEAENKVSVLIIGVVAEEARSCAEFKGELRAVPLRRIEKRSAVYVEGIRNAVRVHKVDGESGA